jgi:hypothetical protein
MDQLVRKINHLISISLSITPNIGGGMGTPTERGGREGGKEEGAVRDHKDVAKLAW